MLFKKTRNKLGHSAFTLHEEGILREIITECQVSIPFDPRSGRPHPPILKIKALWDTGASHCAITQKVIKALNLIPFTKVPVGHATGSSWQDAFKLNILLPNDVGVVNCNATECVSINGNFDIIIGMDLITKGDFAITNQNGKSVVSFRMPSQTIIDFNFVEEPVAEKKEEPKSEKQKTIDYSKTPLNAPCPCGSGKKFKRCHGAKK
jgi:hypothetical protein